MPAVGRALHGGPSTWGARLAGWRVDIIMDRGGRLRAFGEPVGEESAGGLNAYPSRRSCGFEQGVELVGNAYRNVTTLRCGRHVLGHVERLPCLFPRARESSSTSSSLAFLSTDCVPDDRCDRHCVSPVWFVAHGSVDHTPKRLEHMADFRHREVNSIRRTRIRALNGSRATQRNTAKSRAVGELHSLPLRSMTRGVGHANPTQGVFQGWPSLTRLWFRAECADTDNVIVDVVKGRLHRQANEHRVGAHAKREIRSTYLGALCSRPASLDVVGGLPTRADVIVVAARQTTAAANSW